LSFKLDMAVKPFRYFHEYHHRLRWPKLEDDQTSWYGHYFGIFRGHEHVGEAFLGKSGLWFVVMFTEEGSHPFVSSPVGRVVLDWATGIIYHGVN
jgi:hypothetical protein